MAAAHTAPIRLGSIRIVTRDVPVLVRFYQSISGVSPVGCDDYAEFHFPAATLSICSTRGSDLFTAGAAVPAANRSVVIEFEVCDVDRERARLGALVGSFVMEPTDQPWGNRSMLFRDPDGNLINFYAAKNARAPGHSCNQKPT